MDIRKLCREVGDDTRADMGEVDATTAYELAGCLLDDPKVLAAAKKQWPGKSKTILQELMADCI